jgi:hypothetical protein
MTQIDEQRCEELRNALKDARSRLNPPTADSALQGAQAARNIDPGDTTPDADPGLWDQIRNIERALRDAGCE